MKEEMVSIEGNERMDENYSHRTEKLTEFFANERFCLEKST
jgi:hypothetical protein